MAQTKFTKNSIFDLKKRSLDIQNNLRKHTDRYSDLRTQPQVHPKIQKANQFSQKDTMPSNQVDNA